MKIIEFYKDYNIQYWTECNNCALGWVNIQCPFCGDVSNHLGFNEEEGYFHCWRCGGEGKSLINVVMKLLKTDYKNAIQIIEIYEGSIPKTNKIKYINKKPFKFPTNITPLTAKHKKYLRKRGFNNSHIKKWNLQATNLFSMLGGLNFKNRILIPIYWQNEIVSFQTRDITGKVNKRYITCPHEFERIHHKHIIYVSDHLKKEVGICVEGVTDVWKLGDIGFATFGIEVTRKQIQMISEMYKKVIIAFDPEPQAQKKAKLLSKELQFKGIQVIVIEPFKEVGDMNKEEIEEFKKESLNKLNKKL